jgi:hypothetical protein
MQSYRLLKYVVSTITPDLNTVSVTVWSTTRMDRTDEKGWLRLLHPLAVIRKQVITVFCSTPLHSSMAFLHEAKVEHCHIFTSLWRMLAIFRDRIRYLFMSLSRQVPDRKITWTCQRWVQLKTLEEGQRGTCNKGTKNFEVQRKRQSNQRRGSAPSCSAHSKMTT